MKIKQIKPLYLLIMLNFCFFSTLIIKAQDTIKRPDYSAYYFHRVDHFRLLPNDKDEIIFLGDSITDGAEWTELIGNLKVKNRGISGDVTDGILYRLDEVTESLPSRIFIMVGVNDLANGVSVNNIFENYTKILDFIKSKTPKTEVFVQSILPVNDSFPGFKNHTNKTDRIIELNLKLNKLAIERGYIYVDLFTPFASDNKLKKELTEDGLHVNGKGYLLWYSLIKKWL